MNVDIVTTSLLRRNRWRVLPQFRNSEVGDTFSSIEKVFELSDTEDRVTSDSESTVFRQNIDGSIFYVKRFHSTRGIRSWLGKSRLRGEWHNLKLFSQLGISTAQLVAFGEERCLLRAGKGALITASLPDSVDLAELASREDARLKDPKWVATVSNQIACFTKKLHNYNFAHNDLKWRNILVTNDSLSPQVFFIDCPTGQRWFGPFLSYRIIKDLACLDKLGKKYLSNTQRLKFYKQYKGIDRLSSKDKKAVKKITNFFNGRE
ncbi:heptose kinase [Sansalvadorimonas sp. 2012CJ34-2]|uniref:Heptose kinase n=1 Tax=Parendozoicomonas callyspongiae TaxID=2942213 RepID=A0ABT0PMC5_9GAMM|nr:lipopolysaccharide kinase InaA family protein [Sansalvadorimonas sp. 2012CJ34-2]MCL6271618.1 heptose kinase [Sansalvadorimonas sp. 2012CJ34-2]